MSRYIDANALIDRMRKGPLFEIVEMYGVTGVIEAEPTADVVELEGSKVCKCLSYTTTGNQTADVRENVHAHWEIVYDRREIHLRKL